MVTVEGADMRMTRLVSGILAVLLSVCICAPVSAFAEGASERFIMGVLYNTGKDNGYSKQDPIGEDDVHYGWNLGVFSIGGYTSIDRTDSNNPVFLKNSNEKINLFFELKQDITKLNGSETLAISSDANGYDKALGVGKSDFGYGALIVKRDNPFNSAEEAVTKFNFLSETAKQNSQIKAHEFDEGVYDVSLDYEIKNTSKTFASYTNYKITFRFTVKNAEEQNTPENIQRYNLGELVNTGKDNGYSGNEKITIKDPHYGWEIGKFFVEGFTSYNDTDKTQPIFLKNAGDEVTLKFHLQQDIAKLNGNEKITISEDTNGYDQQFGVEKTNLGHGALFIRVTDYQNITSKPEIYTNYLAANAAKTADTTVKLCEEGDYEVALDYEIKDKTNIVTSYNNYRISFRFSVRNGNCMIFPREVGTGSELLNTSLTKKGFYLDFAKSRYLDITINKSVLVEGANELLDTRFNKVAKDGEEFTDEGVYTITANNRYTSAEPTVKVIYVGENDIIRAHVTTDLPISEIRTMLSQGAVIQEDGTISIPQESFEPIDVSYDAGESESEPGLEAGEESSDIPEENTPTKKYTKFYIIGGGAALVMIAVIIVVVTKHKKSIASKTDGSDEE